MAGMAEIDTFAKVVAFRPIACDLDGMSADNLLNRKRYLYLFTGVFLRHCVASVLAINNWGGAAAGCELERFDYP